MDRKGGLLSASFVATGTGTVGLAFAGTTSGAAAMVGGGGWQTSGNHSILGGNQAKVPIASTRRAARSLAAGTR